MKRAKMYDRKGQLQYDAPAPRQLEPGCYSPLPPYEPIDWTPENASLFLNGVMKVEMMTRAEFAKRYPSTPLPEPDDKGI